MAEDDTLDGQENGAEEAKPKSKKKLIIIIAVVVVLLGAGIPAAVLLGGGAKESANKQVHDEGDIPKRYITAELGTFIVNLSRASNFLKVEILLEYDPDLLMVDSGQGHGGGAAYGGGAASAGGETAPAKAALPPIFLEREPMIYDAVISVLSSKTPEQVLTVDGKEVLKDELIEIINEALALEEAPVVGLYFKQFIIQ